ncbi:DUF3392 domain-containing protein [Neiella holothuriorum]|uniref:DUF3392 domain-containing protein n=1 Tax=Neiella holothuriorum TaxID=2870530 RepID=UPI00298F757A|nr:DUF3392 domain-containing protein [Neiella holothuriorum]
MTSISNWIYGELATISTALLACSIVVFGADINQVLRKAMRGQHFVVRTSVFILINAFGFGFVIVKMAPWLASQLAQLSLYWLIGSLLVAFFAIGSWAQRNRHV